MILISGASGFIGQRLYQFHRERGDSCCALVRRPLPGVSCRIADLRDMSALRAACEGIDSLIHCAGYAHVSASRSDGDKAAHWQINYLGTRNLVEAAGQAGVRRLVFLSSVKALAEPGEHYVNEDFPGEPRTAYGIAKRAAELAVLEGAGKFFMHVVNLRLAMVYGAGGKGNLERMASLVRKNLFPPLPETGNHRSLVHIDDVMSAVEVALTDSRAGGRTYIVASRDAPSGRGLFDALRITLGMPPVHWSVPKSVLSLAGFCGDGMERILGRRFIIDTEAIDRLLNSAWYCPDRIERELGWRAQIPLLEGLSEMLNK
jgi:UDP-glucose 4-epimerase